ncbi:MAG: sigma-70 family RNA polymerase sigma factor [Bacteroidota bacterium]
MEEDLELVERFRGGDERAFDALVEKHYQRVCNILSYTVGATSTVEDLAQEVFIKAYHALGLYRGESAFSTWLYRITVNVGLDELRREKRRRVFSFRRTSEHRGDEGDLAEAIIGQEGADHALEQRELTEILQRALKKIPEKHRIVFALREVEGFTYGEIADMLQCSIGTVKSRLFHARLKLRRYLRPYLR